MLTLSRTALYMPTDEEPPFYAQAEYRARNDDGSEAAATWKAGADTPWNQAIGQPFRVRIRVEKSGSAATPRYGWQYSLDGLTGWTDMPPQGATGVPVRYADSSYLTDASPTTQQLGIGTFDAGRIYESDHALSVTMTASGETEVEGVFELVSGGISPTDKVWLRVVREATG